MDLYVPTEGLRAAMRDGAGVRYAWAFPNMTFAAEIDAAWLLEVCPLGPDRRHVSQTACFPSETLSDPRPTAKAGASLARFGAALSESVPALESQRRAAARPDARQGRLQSLPKPNVAIFVRWSATQIDAAL